MLEKIFDFTIYFLGASTFAIGLVFIVISIAERIQIKVRQGKDPKTNIKHINRLIRKIENQGWRVEAYDTYVFDESKDRSIPTYKPIGEVRLSKTRLTKLGVEVDEENNIVS